ncbi:MAG: cytidine deaminase [Gammaproteobacteria bacterium]|nr:cytidine deaminase [Gammaproteobacteria bacterium]
MKVTVRNEDLINAAKEAREQAYCRYSGFSVGAAIIDDQNRLHVGCNVENAAYNLGNCAEAAAIAAMVQEGGKRIARIAVAGGRSELTSCTPCGGCRQRITEFADKNTVVIVIDDGNEWQEYSIDTLLPASFHLD